MPNRKAPLATRAVMKIFSLILLAGALAACETPVRIPGLSFSFPESVPAIASQAALADTLTITPAVDLRKKHYGRDVAQSGWTACKADTLEAGDMPKLVDARIAEALTKANTFAAIGAAGTRSDWTLTPEVEVFCSQTRGFVIRRIVGLVAIKFTLRKGDVIAWEQSVEHAVTDDDPEYTGSSVTTIEQAMRRTMADSLRLVLRDAILRVDQTVRRS